MNDLRIIPQPTTVAMTDEFLVLGNTITKKVLSNLQNSFDDFPRHAEKELNAFGLNIRFFEVTNQKDQAYKIKITAQGIVIYGKDSSGLKYGFLSLLQILARNPKKIPCGTISDQPINTFRGFHLDLRIHKYKPEFIVQIIKNLARLKFSHLVIEYADCYPYLDEVYLTGEIYYSVMQINEFNKVAKACGIEIIPYLPIFSRNDKVLDLAPNAGLDIALENENGVPLLMGFDFSNPKGFEIISYQLEQLIKAHHPKTVFLDFSAYDFQGQNFGCKYLSDATFEKAFKKLFAILDKNAVQPLIFSDLFLEQPSLIDKYVKNPIVLARQESDQEALTQLASAAQNGDMLLINEVALIDLNDSDFTHNTRRIIKDTKALADAKRLNGALVSCSTSVGMTSVSDYITRDLYELGARKIHIDALWYAISFMADQIWNPNGCSVLEFSSRWPFFWFGVDDDRFVEIQYLLNLCSRHFDSDKMINEANKLLKLRAKLVVKLRASELNMLAFYAEMSLVLIKIDNVFSKKPSRRELSYLQKDIDKIKVKHKTIMHRSLFRHEVKQEQFYFFAYAEKMIRMYSRKL